MEIDHGISFYLNGSLNIQAIDIIQPDDPEEEAHHVSRTPIYSYAAHVTMGGSFATHWLEDH